MNHFSLICNKSWLVFFYSIWYAYIHFSELPAVDY